jgi:dihydrofolate reductase
MIINGIVAMSSNNGIGINNKLPWKIPGELKRFKELTIGNNNNAIIMGRNTWNSIPILPNRDHLIISTTIHLDYTHNNNIIKTFISIDDLLSYLKNTTYDDIWVIGGSQIYESFLKRNIITNLYVTYINEEYKCDTFFPPIPDNYLLIKKETLSFMTLMGNCIYANIYKNTS